MRNWMVGASAILVASCSQNPVDTSAAERGVTQFRRLMDAHDYGAIYAAASPEFRQSGSESTTLRFLEAVSTRLGRVLESAQQGWRVTTNNNGTYVSLGYATTFARGRGTEEFVFSMHGQEARLAGYHINSMDLMIDQIAPANNQAAGNEVTRVEAMGNASEAVLLPPERPLNQAEPASVRR